MFLFVLFSVLVVVLSLFDSCVLFVSEDIHKRASISMSTNFFFLQNFFLEYSFTISAILSSLYLLSQIVLKSNGRLDALSIFNLQ